MSQDQAVLDDVELIRAAVNRMREALRVRLLGLPSATTGVDKALDSINQACVFLGGWGGAMYADPTRTRKRIPSDDERPPGVWVEDTAGRDAANRLMKSYLTPCRRDPRNPAGPAS